MREFTNPDWYCYPESQRFADGSNPMIEEYGMTTVLVDAYGVSVMVASDDGELDCYYSFEYVATSTEDKQYLIDVANKIVADIKGMTTNQMIRYIGEL